MVLAPTVDAASLGQGKAKAITYRDRQGLSLDLFDSVWCQKFTEGSSSPQEEAPGVV